MANPIRPKFTFSDIDTEAIDPDRINFGTCLQDCSQITTTFERGAHSTASEAAIFAPLTRILQNNKKLAAGAATALSGYFKYPEEAASFLTEEQGGASTNTNHNQQSINFGTQKQNTLASNFGERFLDLKRECIPCDQRIEAFLEIHPGIDLLSAFENHLTGQLDLLNQIIDLFKNFDVYGDFCNLLNLLSFICIPDLQRIIALLMAQLILDVSELDSIIGLLQGLIIPIFAPILMSITGLLDQFTLLVTSPLECVIDAINLQLAKLRFDTSPAIPVSASTQVASGIQQLQNSLTESKATIEDKLSFYIGQLNAMMGELGGGDSAYIAAMLKKLQIVRMISFVRAIVLARAKSHAACSSTQPAALNEIDNFFQTFLNPNGSFNLWVDNDGQIHIDEKDDNIDILSNTENVLKFEGEPLLDSVATQIEEVAVQLSAPIRAIAPCRLETQANDVAQVNDWIAELNNIS